MTGIDRKARLATEEAARLRRKDRWWKLGLAWGLLLVLAAVAVTGWAAMENRSRADAAYALAVQEKDEKQSLADAFATACAAADFAETPAGKAVCAKADAASKEASGVAGYDMPPLDVYATVTGLFKNYCSSGICKGEPGSPPSPEQIADAFADFCASTGECQGPQGHTPTPAMTLAAVTTYCADGACKGADGKNASTEMVAQAVTAYCATGQCVGPKGEPGSPGSVGPAPASFEFVDPSGATQACVPDPPGTTTYRCTPKPVAPSTAP